MNKFYLKKAEFCDVVGLYMLSQLQAPGINIGLYRDDGLATSQLANRQTQLALQKIDLQSGTPLGSVMFGGDWEGGEFVFAPSTAGREEDDGYQISVENEYHQ